MSKKFEDIFEVFAWLRIVAAPLIIACIPGAIVYFNFPGPAGLIGGICSVLTGLIIGIIWANRVWKKQGTTHFISRINASEDLDSKVRPSSGQEKATNKK
ncbi:MAG: hypothetical protein HYZ14_19035 [Bacteroidetes bacterium]|nr:hypothetical protein [Bacteroidota bacterium]